MSRSASYPSSSTNSRAVRCIPDPPPERHCRGCLSEPKKGFGEPREGPVGTGSSQSQHPEHARHTMNSTAFVIASAADKIMPKVAGPRAV